MPSHLNSKTSLDGEHIFFRAATPEVKPAPNDKDEQQDEGEEKEEEEWDHGLGLYSKYQLNAKSVAFDTVDSAYPTTTTADTPKRTEDVNQAWLQILDQNRPSYSPSPIRTLYPDPSSFKTITTLSHQRQSQSVSILSRRHTKHSSLHSTTTFSVDPVYRTGFNNWSTFHTPGSPSLATTSSKAHNYLPSSNSTSKHPLAAAQSIFERPSLKLGWVSFLPPSPSLERTREKWHNMDEKSSIPTYPSSSVEGVETETKQPGTPISYSGTPDSSHDSAATPAHTLRETINGDNASTVEGEHGEKVKKDLRFWMIFVALMLIAFCAALDMTMISTALPAIVADLPPSTIAANWITSAFLLPMVASQPIFGGLASSIGRKSSINTALLIFLVGSVVCACAKTLLVLVIGRGIQGLGGGGIHAMCEIIMSDLTTLRERGLFFGLIALVFAVAGFVAPVLGGAFGQSSWPWIFWINLPIGAVALVLLVLFLNIRVPLLTGKEKWQKLDVVGNTILFGSVTSILIAVTEGGIKYRWSDHRIWVPLVVGLIGMVAFLAVEWIPNRLARKPVFPLDLFQNRTAAFSYLQTFMHGIVFYGVIYMVPIYFQAIKDRTPLQSAIWSFPLTAPSFPIAMAAGIALSVTGKYKLLIFLGWALMAAGVGWITHWSVSTSKAEWALSQMLAGAGLGILFPITLPPIQASLPSSRLESATAAYAFTRTFGAVWGITGATTIFSTTAARNLRPLYPQLNPLGLNDFTVVAYSEYIRHLPEPLQGVVKQIYADAIAKSYWLFVPLAIIGFVTTVGIKELPLPDFIKSDAKFERKQALEVGNVVGNAEVPSTIP